MKKLIAIFLVLSLSFSTALATPITIDDAKLQEIITEQVQKGIDAAVTAAVKDKETEIIQLKKDNVNLKADRDTAQASSDEFKSLYQIEQTSSSSKALTVGVISGVVSAILGFVLGFSFHRQVNNDKFYPKEFI